MSDKKLTAMTVVSNDLIRFSGAEADLIVQQDLAQAHDKNPATIGGCNQ